MGSSHSEHSSHPSGGGRSVHDVPENAAEIASHAGEYLKVGAALLVLTGVTVGLSYVDFGSRDLNIVVGMIVATIKAGLVAAIFMHLKGEKITIWRFLVMTAIFAIGLFFLTYLAHSDPIGGTSHATH
jgi:cytochrome c oxidase subunit IV